MDIRSDVPLRGSAWDQAINSYKEIFEPRTQYMLFMLSLAVGIMYDKRIASPEGDNDAHSIARNIFRQHDHGRLDFYFEAAILTTTTEDLTEEQRLELAFGEKESGEFRKIDFLLEFANFGVTKLTEQIGVTKIETMENIKNFLAATVEGRNFDIDSLPLDDIEIEEM